MQPAFGTSAALAAVRGALDQEQAIVAVQRAIQVPSVFGSEGQVGEYLVRLMQELSFTRIERQEVQPNRFNVVGTLDTGRPGPTVVLQGHMDTIAPGNHPEAFAGTVRDGRIWGRGTSDMKGPVVAAILAVDVARRADHNIGGKYIVAATVDEESEKRGAFALVEHRLVADFGICVEPTDLRLAIAQKGCVSMRVTTHGLAAHGANPHLGVNAIRKMANVIEAISEAALPEVTLPQVGIVKGTYSIGVVEGGHMFFIVPDRCSIWVDRRTVPSESQDEALQRLRETVAAVDDDAEVVVERQDWHWDKIQERGIGSCAVDPNSPIVRWVADAVQLVTGKPPEYYVQNAWCETDFLVNDLGIPTINFGPGKMELAHTSDEHIDIDSLIQGIETLALTLISAGHQASRA